VVTVKIGDWRRTKMTLIGPAILKKYARDNEYWQLEDGETVELLHVEYFTVPYFGGQADWRSEGFDEPGAQ